jgi:hypothetical protein
MLNPCLLYMPPSIKGGEMRCENFPNADDNGKKNDKLFYACIVDITEKELRHFVR